jgi:hypothetical protein
MRVVKGDDPCLTQRDTAGTQNFYVRWMQEQRPFVPSTVSHRTAVVAGVLPDLRDRARSQQLLSRNDESVTGGHRTKGLTVWASSCTAALVPPPTGP